MARNPLKDWKAGQVIPEDRLNDIHAWIRSLRVTGSSPLIVKQTPDGTHLSLAAVPQFDLIELTEHLLAGKLDQIAQIMRRDFAASGSAADQLEESLDQLLEHTMDPWRSVWLEGHRGVSWWMPAAGQRVIIPGFNFHIVELTGSLTTGSSTTAKIKTPITGSLADALEAAAVIEITVNDIGTGTTTASGTICIVVQHAVGGKWWVVPAVGAPASIAWAEIEFDVITANFTVADATFAANITKITGDTSVGAVNDDVTINNPVGAVTAHWFHGLIGWRGWATWDPAAGQWNARGLECAAA